MNAMLNLYVLLLLPIAVVVVVALARWLADHHTAVLGDRLRRWGFWAVFGANVVLLLLISATMLAEPDYYSVAAAAVTACATIAAPLGVWFWQRQGGRGLPVAMWTLAGATVGLAFAAAAAPEFWTTVVNDVYPVGLLAAVVALAISVWGRAEPVPGGAALLVVGAVPLAMAGAVTSGSEVLVMLFAPMAIFALLGVLYLVGHRLEAGPTVHDEWHGRGLHPPIAQ